MRNQLKKLTKYVTLHYVLVGSQHWYVAGVQNMRERKENYDSMTECRHVGICCILIQTALLGFFLYLGIIWMVVCNAVGIAVSLIGCINTKKEKGIEVWMFLFASELIVVPCMCNLVLGWGYGFSMYGAMTIFISFYFTYINKIAGYEHRHAVTISVVVTVLGVLSALFAGGYNKQAAVSKETVCAIFSVNLSFCAISLMVYSGNFLREMRNHTSSLEAKNRELDYRANYDPLTGVYNRERFYEEVARTLKENPDTAYCMVCSDIKDFKLVNELYGEATGDKILLQIVAFVKEKLTENSVFGRLGGDKFALCMPKDSFSEKLFYEPIRKLTTAYTSSKFQMHMYLGVYDITYASEAPSTICDKANIAIQEIKGDYQTVVAYYDTELLEKELNKRQIISNFEQALSEEQFCIYLQPQTDKDGKAYGAEALVRWMHPEKGLLMPGSFIEYFEAVGLIYRLDMCVWELAAKQLSEWKKIGRTDFYISVNISAKDFYYIDVYETITGLVKEYDISPENLRLELTETVLATDAAGSIDQLQMLHDDGFIIEIDDFGSGYSSLNMLKDVCADVVKIDRGFLKETENAERSRDILAAVILLSKHIGMTVITEGVETLDQVEMITQMGGEMFQGFYFSKPLPVALFETKYLRPYRS